MRDRQPQDQSHETRIAPDPANASVGQPANTRTWLSRLLQRLSLGVGLAAIAGVGWQVYLHLPQYRSTLEPAREAISPEQLRHEYEVHIGRVSTLYDEWDRANRELVARQQELTDARQTPKQPEGQDQTAEDETHSKLRSPEQSLNAGDATIVNLEREIEFLQAEMGRVQMQLLEASELAAQAKQDLGKHRAVEKSAEVDARDLRE